MSKLINNPTVQLVLSTANATTSLTGNLGFTWNNINLQTLLGNEMYNKYDLFNICLVQACSGVAAAGIGTTTDDLNVLFNLSGPYWINQGYNVTHNAGSSNAVAGLYQFSRSNSVMQNYYGNTALTFSKNQSLLNLSITYSTVASTTGAAPNTASAYPPMVFIFSIVGVPKSNIGSIDTSNQLIFSR